VSSSPDDRLGICAGTLVKSRANWSKRRQRAGPGGAAGRTRPRRTCALPEPSDGAPCETAAAPAPMAKSPAVPSA
jgi:hypothetical protein